MRETWEAKDVKVMGTGDDGDLMISETKWRVCFNV